MKKVLVVVSAMMMFIASAPPANAAGYQFRVISHNVAGGPRNGGNESALQTVYDQIPLFTPDVVMLQEVCLSQRDMFEQEYRSKGWTVHWTPMRVNHPNCHEIAAGVRQPQGQLLASKWPMTNVTSTPLPGSDTQLRQFSLLCATIEAGVTTRACTTHLMAGEDNDSPRTLQTAAIDATVTPFIAAGMPVVVGGDLNSTPRAQPMDNMYRLDTDGSFTGKGQFHEADQTDSTFCNARACRAGQATFGASGSNPRKLDYIFFSANRCTGLGNEISGGVIDSTVSDHELYRGWCNLS